MHEEDKDYQSRHFCGVAAMGHYDWLIVTDASLPIPNEVLPSPDRRSAEIQAIFPKAKSFPVPYLEFKKLALEAGGIVRTGDFHAYGNVLIASGVAY